MFGSNAQTVPVGRLWLHAGMQRADVLHPICGMADMNTTGRDLKQDDAAIVPAELSRKAQHMCKRPWPMAKNNL